MLTRVQTVQPSAVTLRCLTPVVPAVRCVPFRGSGQALPCFSLLPGNLNAFLTAVDSTYRVGGVPSIALADAAIFDAGRATELAAAIGASVGLAGQQTQLSRVLCAAYARAVAHAIARWAG